jgi:hypothetical protein
MKCYNDIPRTRSTDPDTSRQAELFMRSSGLMNEQQADVLRVVRFRPGETAREYQATNAVEGMFHRRLIELLRKGLVRRGEVRTCRVGGRKAATWYPNR